MKTSFLTLFLITAVSLTTFSQTFKDLDASPMDAAAYPTDHNIFNKLVKIIYSRPQLRGRTVESLTPYGKVWRTGANEATEITFYNNVLFGGKKVKAGVYSLFTVPGEKNWTVIINSDIDVWGAYTYNAKHDIVRVEVPVEKQETFIEAFSIAFANDASMHLAWGNLRIAIPIEKL